MAWKCYGDANDDHRQRQMTEKLHSQSRIGEEVPFQRGRPRRMFET